MYPFTPLKFSSNLPTHRATVQFLDFESRFCLGFDYRCRLEFRRAHLRLPNAVLRLVSMTAFGDSGTSAANTGHRALLFTGATLPLILAPPTRLTSAFAYR